MVQNMEDVSTEHLERFLDGPVELHTFHGRVPPTGLMVKAFSVAAASKNTVKKWIVHILLEQSMEVIPQL